MTELESLHSAILVMAQELHRICEEHDIKYSMNAGTMLGAIRHKGFIPWDDDLDIAMTYDNYKKFINVMSTINHPWLEIELPLEESYAYFLKVYDKRTTFIQSQRQEKSKGVFIDVFPVVHAGNTLEEVKHHIKKCSFYKALLLRKTFKNSIESIKDFILSFIACFYSKSQIYKRLIQQYEIADSEKTDYSAILFSWSNDVMPTSVYENVKLYDFENIQLYGVENYDKYLSDKFGKYMQLPPKEQQIPHHFYLLDLKTPYREYKANLNK